MRAKFLSLLLVARAAYCFDAPQKVQHVDLGLASDTITKLHGTCSYFATFMIKAISLDPPAKGGDELSVVPIAKGEVLPLCQKSNFPKEISLKVASGDGGYFIGAKSNFVFTDDYADPGPPEFSVFDATTGKQLFTDHYQIEREITLVGTGLKMHYRRAVDVGCSVPRDKQSCWAKIEKSLNVKSRNVPRDQTAIESRHAKLQFAKRNCAVVSAQGKNAVTECIQKEMNAKPMEWMATADSFVGYPVEAIWDGSKLSLASIDGPVDWWPSN